MAQALGAAKSGPSRKGGMIIPWALAAGLLLWLYAPQMVSMVRNWWLDPNYSHGFLVPLVSAGLIWRQRKRLAAIAAPGSAWGLLFVAAGLALLALGQLAQENYLQRISLIPVLWGLTLITWGWPVSGSVWFSFVYLSLMVPLPYVLYDSVAFPLRLLAAELAGSMLRLAGMAVFVDGNAIHLPYVMLDVVDACSGIRSLISLLAAGVIMAYLMLPNRWSKVLVVFLVLPVAVLSNALRVVVAGLLARYYGQAALEGVMHDTVGWAVFVFAFGVLIAITLGLGALLGKKETGHDE